MLADAHHDLIQVTPTFSLISVEDIRRNFKLTGQGVHDFLEVIEVPILDAAKYTGEHHPVEYVSAVALELALFAHLMPTSEKFESLRADPEAMLWILGLFSLMYTVSDKEDLRARLRIKGDQMMRRAFRAGRPEGSKNKEVRVRKYKEGKENSARRAH